jgi:hypothetical protein
MKHFLAEIARIAILLVATYVIVTIIGHFYFN